jgi:hypothetical protein
MPLFEEARTILEKEGYQTLPAKEGTNVFYFEDDVLLGFVAVHRTGDSIVTNWQREQDAFLQSNAGRLRPAAQKAWNVYSVFLTPESCTSTIRAALIKIEEDFTSTRKIARSGLTNPTEITRALLPLLRIQKRPTPGLENLRTRLQERLNMGDEEVSLLLQPSKVADIVKMVKDRHS